MFTQPGRTVLFAALLTATMALPAMSADVPPAIAEATEQTYNAAASSGPMIARESLATETAARATVTVDSKPARAAATPAKRVAAYQPTRSHASFRRPPLILGISH
jgi:hypothetical protein